MALINCPECEKQISDKAPACPNCGVPLGDPSPAPTSTGTGSIGCAGCRQSDRVVRVGALQLTHRKHTQEVGEVDLQTNGISVSGNFALTDDFALVSSPWTGLSVQASSTSGTIQTSGTSESGLLRAIEYWIPVPLPGDPIPTEFDAQLKRYEDALVCERCATATLEGEAVKFDQLSLRVFGPTGLTRSLEYQSLVAHNARANFGVLIRRKGTKNATLQQLEGIHSTISNSFQFNPGFETRRLSVDDVEIRISAGSSGSQAKAKAMGAMGKASWWPTTGVVSSMLDSTTGDALYSVVATADYENSALTAIGISGRYKKRFGELAEILNTSVK